ncbi:hypothetical protein SAMN05216184_10315 [Georgenia satyanarayanai]|uniref:Uncharacterized protein n=1 Tax=Georgenia satyanarayanai TaxID=860221 RepID=A0A2Y9A7A2_9MICO|nr:hypothetical protein [Georgenia satyanarayanai]PYG00445.1 hypothetical protein A8987_10315 [Georgenia satyanarayanai]SSA39826.1 hypothetical protein SAMN05216184_10315 [Georgenia satyanarayanai]
MTRIALGASAVLATLMGVVGAVTSFEEGAFTVGTVLIVLALGSVAIHAVLSPQSYRHPRFTGTFYRVWGIGVPLLAVAALVTSAFAPETAQQVAYWSGFASVALLAGAVVDHRTARTTVSSR